MSMNRLRMLATASAALAAMQVLPTAARAAVPLNVGVGPDEDFAEGYYANDTNFFQQAGIVAALTEIGSGAALSAAAVSGALDVATTNMGSIITAYGHNVPLQIIAPGAIYSNTELSAALIVAKDSAIRSAADLRGKTIAVSTLNTLYHTSVRNWIDKNGGASADVRFVEMPLSSHLTSLVGGRIDAAASVEPWLSQAKGQTRVLGDPYSSVANRFLISCWVANTSWCEANRSTLDTFRAVMRKTAAWANQNPRQTAAILSKYFKVDLAIVQAIPRTEMGINLDPKLVQPVIDMLVRYKLAPAEFDAINLFAKS
jgi:NitT/TauT family transport system substrate-binding protein